MMTRKKLYVRNSRKEAEAVLTALGLDKEWLEAGIGTVLAGRKFEKIVFDIDTKYIPKTHKARIEAYQQLCRTKLEPNGEIKFI